MNHRERVRTVLRGGVPDRTPIDLGGWVASMNTNAYLDLKEYLGFGRVLDVEAITLLNTIARFDERVLERLDIDIRHVFLRGPRNYTRVIAADGSFRDEWGVGYVVRGPYNERVGHPLASSGLSDLDAYAWPDADDPGRTEGLAEEVTRLFDQSHYALASCAVTSGFFQVCWNLRGMEQFLVDMAAAPDFAEALLERTIVAEVSQYRRLLAAVGPYIDIAETADDIATQRGPLISPAMYRRYLKPRRKLLNDAIRAQTSARILYHSCGAVVPFIDDLIDIGVQVLNPVQPISGLMEAHELKRRYGRRLVFHGGLDVQGVLPRGTVGEVRDEVHRLIDELGADGGYILAPTNMIQPDTPPRNVVAAYEAARTYREY